MAAALDAAGGTATSIWAMIETPTAIFDVRSIAAHPRVSVLVMGTNDLAKEIGAPLIPGRSNLTSYLATAVLAAREAGKVILDGVYNDVRDADGFVAECRQGVEMGFDGKTLIHPDQVGPANHAWSPSADEVEYSRRVDRGLLGRRDRGPRRHHRGRQDDREPPRGQRPPDAHRRRRHRRPRRLTARRLSRLDRPADASPSGPWPRCSSRSTVLPARSTAAVPSCWSSPRVAMVGGAASSTSSVGVTSLGASSSPASGTGVGVSQRDDQSGAGWSSCRPSDPARCWSSMPTWWRRPARRRVHPTRIAASRRRVPPRLRSCRAW